MARISLCKHGFPIQPPHGSFARPGDCTGCGITWEALQAELQRQEDTIRMRTAHEGDCELCGHTRMLFRFQREQQPWDEGEPPVRWLCIPCWGNAKTTEENTGFSDFNDVFDNGTDDQLARFVFGGAR
ncbi:hypothetical protein [Streptomyces sp. 184]|jgi:hypothetical protein|uniref:hypothetical protein n=1 Tax=Streptomyces sp. 184 TaxID=1827526 RepID=UPI0038914FEE